MVAGYSLKPLILLAMATFAALWIVGLGWLNSWGEEKYADARRAIEVDANHVASEVSRLSSLSQSFAAAVDGWLAHNGRGDPRFDPDFALFGTTIRYLSGGIFLPEVIDEKGDIWQVPASQGKTPYTNGAHRDYFLAQQDPATRGVYVSVPFVARISKRQILPVAYPLQPNSQHLLLAIMVIDLERFGDAMRSYKECARCELLMHRADGRVLYSHFATMPLGAVDPAFYQESSLKVVVEGGVEKLVARRKVDGLPIWVTVCVPTAEYLQGWTRVRWSMIAGLLIMTLLMALAGWHHLRAVLGNLALADQLLQSENRLNEAQRIGRIGHWSFDALSGAFEASEVCRDVLGLKESVEGQALMRLIGKAVPSRDRHRYFEWLSQFRMGQADAQGDFPYRRGSEIAWIRLIGHRRGEGEYFGIVQDISERKRLEIELERQALTDALTGLPNRRSFIETADHEVERAWRYGRDLAILMVDIDHFKRINDSLGHAAGDAVLKAVAAAFLQALRNVDVVARWGGEEFVVLAVETDAARSAQIAERVRQHLATMVVPFGGQHLGVTVSIGTAQLGADGETLDGLLQVADRRLYRAKEAGRNQVVTT